MKTVTLIEAALSKISNKDFEFLIYLHDRYASEKDFEDFTEYEKIIKRRFSYLKLISVNKKPFGFSFDVAGNIVRIEVKFKGSDVIIDATYKTKELVNK